MSKSEEETNSYWFLPILHEFSCGIIDCGDMVRINCMPQAETVSKQDKAHESRILI